MGIRYDNGAAHSWHPGAIDGCIAQSVMKLLNDPRVRAYLAH